MMLNSRVCLRAHISWLCVRRVWVVWRQHGGRGTDYRADFLIEGLALRLLNFGLEDWTCCGVAGLGVCWDWDRRVLLQVVVVVCGCFAVFVISSGAVLSCVLMDGQVNYGERCGVSLTYVTGQTWPGLLMSNSGCWGGSTVLVVPTTGQT